LIVANSEVVSEEIESAELYSIVSSSDTDVGLDSVIKRLANVYLLRVKAVLASLDGSS